MKHLFFIIILTFFFMGFSQDDITMVGELPSDVFETSGLIFYNNKLITHNDSGNLPQLYEIDTLSLQVVRTVTISNVVNTDWEDITQDDDFIYIGDIGNNSGNRQDLKIIKISKSDYNQSNTVVAETIDFFYEDQEDFTTTQNSDWDAEALFVFGENLIILTKEWQSQGTVAYRLPIVAGAFLAERLGNFQVDGLVTAATYDEAENELYLQGYSQFLAPFFVRIKDVDVGSIFPSEAVKTNLSLGIAQTEAITQVGNTFYVSSEEFRRNNPPINSASRLFRFSLNSEEIEEPEGEEPEPNEPDSGNRDGLILYRSFGSEILNYALNIEAPIFGRGIFDSVGRMIEFTPLERLSENSIDLSTLEPSIYHLAFFYGDNIISKSFIRD